MASYPTGVSKGATHSKFTGALEHNNHKQGREGAGTMKKPGLVSGVKGTPAKSGGINRAVKPHSV